MYQIQVSAQAAGIIPDRAGTGAVIILNINGRMACSTIHPCRQRHTGNLCSHQVTLQTDEAIAAAAFRRGPTGNTAIVIVTEMAALNAETDAVVFTIYTGLMAAGACHNPVIIHCLCQHGGIQGDFCTISIFTAQIPALITVPVEGVVKGTGLQPVPLDKGPFLRGGTVNGFHHLNTLTAGRQPRRTVAGVHQVQDGFSGCPATVNDQSVSIVLCHIRAYTQADGAILPVQVFHFQGCRYELPCAGGGEMNLSGMAEVIHHRLHRGVIGDIPGGTGGESDIRGVNGTVQHSAAGQLQGCTALSNDIRGDGTVVQRQRAFIQVDGFLGECGVADSECATS